MLLLLQLWSVIAVAYNTRAAGTAIVATVLAVLVLQ
jgi:hypothetical protein